MLCAGFALGLAPAAFGQAPDDTGYDRYRGQAGAPGSGDGSTRVGRAWQDVKKWASDRGTGFTKSFADNGQADPSLMPLSPAILPEFANGNRAPAGPAQPPSATQPFAARPQAPPQPPLAKHPQSPYAFGGGPVMAGPQGTGAPPAQLAGKPAYHWYGYGSAPAAGSPQASPNWIAQTGATAGAFPIMAGMPRTVPPPSPPGFVGGPKAVSMIPTLPTIAPPPPPTFASPPAAGEPPTIPTFRPSPTSPAAVYTAPAEAPAPAPKSDEPEWQPAARRPAVEQTSGNSDGGRVVPVAYDGSDNEPSWHTAPPSRKKAVPVVKALERPPALLPVPIPMAPAGVAAIEPVSTSPVTIPVATVPTLVPVPTATPTPVDSPPFQTQPQAQPQPAWQPTAGYQAPPRHVAPVTVPATTQRAATPPTNPSPFPTPSTVGRPTTRPHAPTPPVPATMANGLAAPRRTPRPLRSSRSRPPVRYSTSNDKFGP